MPKIFSNKAILAAFGVAVCIPIWVYFIAPKITELPKNFSYHAEINSFDNLYDTKTQTFAGEVQSNTHFSYQTIGIKNNVSEIKNLFYVKKPSGEEIFSAERLYGIDRGTGAHVPGYGDKSREGFLFAPKNLHKQDFVYWHVNYDLPITMKFQNEDTILSLPVYHYSASFPADQSANLSYLLGTTSTLGINLDVNLELWVEPTTGWLVKYNDSAEAYYYNRTNDQRLWPWNSFRNSYTFQSTSEQVENARAELEKRYIVQTVIPNILVAIALLLLLGSFIWSHLRERIYSLAIPGAVLLTTLSGTYWLWHLSITSMAIRGNARFETEAETIKNSIRRRMDIFANALRGAQGLFAGSQEVTRPEWSAYTKSLALDQNFPGAQGLGYAIVLAPNKLAEHTKKIRSEGFPTYAVHPEGAQDIYSSIVYIEPFNTRNQRAFGYDMLSEPIRRQALNLARDTGQITMSGKIRLVQETTTDIQPGFLLLNPIYQNGQPTNTVDDRRKNIIGFVYSPFRMYDLMRGVIGNSVYNIDYTIFDGTATTNETKMFERTHSDTPVQKPHYTKEDTIAFFNHTWTIHFAAGADYGPNQTEERLPIYVGTAGIIISFLSSGILYFFATSRKRALLLADRITKQLEDRKNELSEYVDAMSTFNAKLDTDGKIVLCNKSALGFTGLPIEQLRKTKIFDGSWWGTPAARERVKNFFEKAITTGKPVVFDEYIQAPDGEKHFLNVSLAPLTDQSHAVRYVVAEGRDISFLKKTEDNLHKRTLELERLNRAMVGRELKMIELKNELKKTNQKNSKPKNQL